jgi:hypothetical protein
MSTFAVSILIASGFSVVRSPCPSELPLGFEDDLFE